MLMIAPQVLEIEEKLLLKYDEACYFVFFPLSDNFSFSIRSRVSPTSKIHVCQSLFVCEYIFVGINFFLHFLIFIFMNCQSYQKYILFCNLL